MFVVICHILKQTGSPLIDKEEGIGSVKLEEDRGTHVLLAERCHRGTR